MRDYLQENEPEKLRARRGKRFVRHHFVAAGVNHLQCFDQHDKWRRFRLYLHVGTEPMSGKITWLRIWWTNSNPRWVTKQFLDFSRSVGGAWCRV
jgi:hypothetical protein